MADIQLTSVKKRSEPPSQTAHNSKQKDVHVYDNEAVRLDELDGATCDNEQVNLEES